MNLKKKAHPPIFIIGCGRSGTTLLKDLLNSSDEIKFPPESHFLLEFHKLYGDPKTEEEAVHLLRRLKKHFRFKRFAVDVGEDEVKDFRNYKDFISHIYNKFAAKYEAPRWGEKTPHYVKNVMDLKELFPDAKFIHILRDGRDVALSIIAREWGPNNVYHASKHWKSYVTAGLKAAQDLGESCLQIKYEDLLANPEELMKKVSDFIDIEYSDKLLTLNSLKEDSYIAQTKNFFGQNTSYRPSNKILVSTNKNKWKKKMKKRDVLIFNQIAGDLLENLGYDLEYKDETVKIGALEKMYLNAHNFLLKIFKELTSKNIYRQMLSKDTFPVIRASSRILKRKHE